MKKTLALMLIPMLAWPLLLAGIAKGQETLYLDAVGTVNLIDPVSSNWHELWPLFSRNYHLSSWNDNGDGKLSPSDQIDMRDEVGNIRWFHVDRVLLTMWLHSKPVGTDTAMDADPAIPPDPGQQITDPLSTNWHEIYPTFSIQRHLTSWTDNGDGYLSASDQIDMVDAVGTVTWYHVAGFTIDIIITEKPIVPEFALGMVMQIALVAAIAYLGFKKLALKPIKSTN